MSSGFQVRGDQKMTSDRFAASARPARVVAMPLSSLLALGLLTWPGTAGATSGVPSRLECSGGVPGCRTAQGAATPVPADSEVQVTLTCPKDARFFWNWSAEPGRHVQVQFVAAVLDQARQAIGATFAIQAQSERNPGSARIALGCSGQLPSPRHPYRVLHTAMGWNPHQ
jgi:hypothetical protein